jgi:low affinity Fe/Cu permease
MDIQATGAAATLALACALVFIVAAKSWYLVLRVLAANPSFADSIMSEAAERFRDDLHRLSRRQSTYLGAGLVFVVMYLAATLFQGPTIFAGYPAWQLYLVFGALTCAAMFAAWRMLQTILNGRRLRFLHDANRAIGHQLQRTAAGHSRAFHDVATAAGIVDHVMAGPDGIYAVTVIAKRRLRKGTVRLDNNELYFSGLEKPVSVVEQTAGGKRLAKEFLQLTGHQVQVRSVIAVPGWDIDEQLSHNHLLVNERTLPMIRGWRDETDYLMDEDLIAIVNDLSNRCKRRKRVAT